ncbi:unnamed protein product [Closterium sp. NIES-53]
MTVIRSKPRSLTSTMKIPGRLTLQQHVVMGAEDSARERRGWGKGETERRWRANASPGECEEALPEPQQRHLLGRRSGGRKEEQKLLRLFPSRFPLRESNKHTRTALPAAPPPPPPLPPPPPPPLIPAPPAPAPPLPMPRGDARTGGSAGKSRPQGDFDAQ